MRKTKALGQHFLINRGVLAKIIKVIAPEKDDIIIEVGAGKGALTFALAERCRRVIAIEKDKTLLPFLQGKKENIVVVGEDVLTVDFRSLLRSEHRLSCRPKLVGNLPYSISSPLLFKVLKDRKLFSSCIFLVQREVAERLASSPGSKTYAPLSILFQMAFELRLHFIVSPGSFLPPPRVESALISLHPREKLLFPIEDEKKFHLFLRKAFAQRRKTLLNNLRSYPAERDQLVRTMARLDLAPDIRPEQVPIEKFVLLFEELATSREENKAHP